MPVIHYWYFTQIVPMISWERNNRNFKREIVIAVLFFTSVFLFLSEGHKVQTDAEECWEGWYKAPPCVADPAGVSGASVHRGLGAALSSTQSERLFTLKAQR